MGKTIRNRDKVCNFFFVQPGSNQNVNSTAKKLMDIEQVKEVHVTEGNFGFVVKAEVTNQSDTDLRKKISKVTEGKSAYCVSYLQFSK